MILVRRKTDGRLYADHKLLDKDEHEQVRISPDGLSVEVVEPEKKVTVSRSDILFARERSFEGNSPGKFIDLERFFEELGL